MHWFFITLISPFAHGIVNFLDKYLINRYTTGNDSPSVGSLTLFSSLFAVVILPIFLIFGIPEGPFNLILTTTLIVSGVIYLGAIIFYLYALSDDDVSNVIPFWLTVPVFDFILAWFFLNEKLSSIQILAALGVLFGGLILSLEHDEEGKVRVKWKPALLMLGSSVCFAINIFLFKKIAMEGSFFDSLFFTYLGYLLGGIVLFIFIRSYRKGFIELLRKSGSVLLGINVLGELLMIAGDMAVRFATLLAPLALVETVSWAFQPVVVFVIGIFMTVFLPHIIKESIEKKELIQKCVAMICMIVGAIFLTLHH